MNKMKKILVPSLLLAAVLLVLVGGQSVLRAVSDLGTVINNYAEGGIVLGGSDEPAFGASGTRFPNGLSTDSTSPSAGQVRTTTLTVTGTSTLQEITLGSNYSKALTFTAAATSTPGGLVALQNTGAPKICQGLPEVQWTSGDLGGSMNFSFGTSTSATAWSAIGGSLISTTTIPTSTPAANALQLFTKPGSFFGGPTATTTAAGSWAWNNGDYVIGAFDIGGAEAGAGTRNNATTTDYTTLAGTMYLDCHTR